MFIEFYRFSGDHGFRKSRIKRRKKKSIIMKRIWQLLQTEEERIMKIIRDLYISNYVMKAATKTVYARNG